MWRIGNFLSTLLSILLQPLLMPFYSLALLMVYTNFYDMYAGQLLRFLLPTFIFTFLLPVLFIFVLWRLKYIKTFDLSVQTERFFPYLVFLMSNVSLTYFFFASGLSWWFLALVAAPFFVALIGMIITMFWKISIHMIGIGGLIGAVLAISFYVKGVNPWMLLIGLFILSGLLGVARLHLKKSTPAQVYAGFAVGLAVAYLSVFLGVYSILYLSVS